MIESEKSYHLSVPSKTFLVGEYGALLDGPAILVNTLPRFELNLYLNNAKEYYVNPIENEKNPLHLFWNENEDFLLDFDSEFRDPYDGGGGFGASSAQWAMYYAFTHQYQEPLKSLFDKTQNQTDFLKTLDFSFIQNFLKKYRSYSQDQYKPSGYDVLSQWIGKVAFIDVKNKILKRLDWPFDDLLFGLVKGQEKIPTHEHLRELKGIPEKEISNIVQETLKAFEIRNSQVFVRTIKESYDLFKKANLVAPRAVEQIERLLKIDGVVAAKGCGALGADVFLLVIVKDKWNSFISQITAEGFPLVATSLQISHGLEIQSNFNSTEGVLH